MLVISLLELYAVVDLLMVAELYQNNNHRYQNKLNYIVSLEGITLFNQDYLNIKNSTSFDGYLQNISYLPYHVSI